MGALLVRRRIFVWYCGFIDDIDGGCVFGENVVDECECVHCNGLKEGGERKRKRESWKRKWWGVRRMNNEP